MVVDNVVDMVVDMVVNMVIVSCLRLRSAMVVDGFSHTAHHRSVFFFLHSEFWCRCTSRSMTRLPKLGTESMLGISIFLNESQDLLFALAILEILLSFSVAGTDDFNNSLKRGDENGMCVSS